MCISFSDTCNFFLLLTKMLIELQEISKHQERSHRKPVEWFKAFHPRRCTDLQNIPEEGIKLLKVHTTGRQREAKMLQGLKKPVVYMPGVLVNTQIWIPSVCRQMLRLCISNKLQGEVILVQGHTLSSSSILSASILGYYCIKLIKPYNASLGLALSKKM